MRCMTDEVEENDIKRAKTMHLKKLEQDKSLVEFPLENGFVRTDYCPIRCTICLLGILKKDAKAGPCITHVFHKDCIEKWAIYCVQNEKPISCPNCLQQANKH